MTRSIVHLDLDAFFVSCEILKNSALRGRPVLIGGNKDRGVVASCSYEARRYGVRTAMPMRYALKLCPDAQVLRGDMDMYAQYSRSVTQVIKEEAPFFEKASIDEFYLDITGMDNHFNCYRWTHELASQIRKEVGLGASFGLSVNKTVSKMGTTEYKPNGKAHIPPKEVKLFLNPLSVGKIPMVGQKTFHTLSRAGIRRIKTLAEMPMEFLRQLLGKNGVVIWEKANGVDPRPVIPYSEKQSISAERTLQKDTIRIPLLKHLLTELTEQLAFELRQSGKLTSVVSVKIRYSNFDTYSKQKRIAYTANDQGLIELVHELFEQLYERRMLIRLVGVKFSGLVSGYSQISLFDERPEITALYRAMDEVRGKFGAHCIRRASGITTSTKYN